MANFIKHLKIKHADIPHMLTYLGIFVVIIIVALLMTSFQTAMILALCLLAMLIITLAFHFYRETEILAVQQQKKNQAYLSLFNLIDFRLPPPYMTSWAATPELVLTIYETIKTEEPENIVELGSGISSLICAYAMEQNNKGSLFSFDHDKKYGNKTREMLYKHQIDQRVTISYAPLRSQKIEDQECIWYDCSSAASPDSVDLLIVDGPPFKTQKRARYPALPHFLPKLSSSAIIIIHDAFRKAEGAIINEWVSEHPEFSKEMINSEKGIAVLKR